MQTVWKDSVEETIKTKLGDLVLIRQGPPGDLHSSELSPRGLNVSNAQARTYLMGLTASVVALQNRTVYMGAS